VEEPFNAANEQTGVKKNPGVACAESAELAMKKRDFRRKDERADKEKEDPLQNRKKAAQNSKQDKGPSQGMPEKFF
jgi:hypothetical protein